jgi:hypothetical protein
MFAENVREFFDEKSGFAKRVLFRFQAGGSKVVVGIFEEGYLWTDSGRIGLETTAPRLLAPSSDVKAVSRGDEAEIERKQYEVLTVEPDGTGLSVVKLAPR